MDAFVHLPAAGYRRGRWRNGGGWTRRIAAGSLATPLFAEADAADGWDWRLSNAQIEADGPFSSFPGMDRTLVLLSGAGMALRFGDGRNDRLGEPLSRSDFSGDSPVDCHLAGGPVSVCNLMWRRAALRAAVTVCPLVDLLVGRPRSWLTLAHVVDGHLHSGDRLIVPGDTLAFVPDRSGGDGGVADADAAPLRPGEPGAAVLIHLERR